MKKEEQILDALGNVKDVYILEASQYMGNEHSGKLIQPSNHKKPRFLSIAATLAFAMMAVALSVLLLIHNPTIEASSTPLSYSFPLDRSRTIHMDVVYDDVETVHNIDRLVISEKGKQIQEITSDDIVDGGIYLNEGLFICADSPIGAPDLRDVNFDGYIDIGILAVQAYPRNVPYHYFLWNETLGRYEYGFTLFGATALQIDPALQILKETENVSLSDGDAPKINLYAFENGKLEPLYPPYNISDSMVPPFSINYDPYMYEMVLSDSGWYIRPLGAGERTDCTLRITFLDQVLPWAAASEALTALEQNFKYVSPLQQDADFGFWFVSAADGAEYDSFDYPHKDAIYINAGRQGTFQLIASYNQKDAAKYSPDLWNMIRNFCAELTASENQEAEMVIMNFADAYFAGNFSEMSKYMVIGTVSSGPYTGDGHSVRIVNLNGLADLDSRIRDSGSANVSIALQETPDADSYTYLTINIQITDGCYQICSYALEK